MKRGTYVLWLLSMEWYPWKLGDINRLDMAERDVVVVNNGQNLGHNILPVGL